MGKLLKRYSFVSSEGFSVVSDASNIQIEPKQHYVLIFDWTTAQVYPEAVPRDIQLREISQAAQAVIMALGGDWKTGVFPDDGEEAFKQYTDHLLQLARGNESNAQRAHTKFYELIDSFWPRKYHPFTTKPL
jgi:hypothetical protein